MSGVLSAGVVVVSLVEGAPRYLLLRCYNYWDFPKGEVESGEEPLAAAIREVEEETSLTGLDFRWGHPYRETEPYGSKSKVARYYLAVTSSTAVSLPINPQLGRPEHDEYRWLGYADAQALLVPRLKQVLDWAQGKVSAG